MNTDWTACAIAENTSCLITAGSALTVAGLSSHGAVGASGRGRQLT